MSRGTATMDRAAVSPKETAAIVAAAITHSGGTSPRRRQQRESWQDQTWDFYDTVGELRYSVSWFANALSRAKFTIVHRTTGNQFEAVNEGPAFEALSELTTMGEAELLKSMGEQYFLPGEWYLVSRKVKGSLIWEVVSVDEMKTIGTGAGARWVIKRDGEDDITLTATDNVIRMWKPHPRKKMRADSPTRGALPILRQIRALSAHIDAQVYSRLAGAGLLLLPQEMSVVTPAKGAESPEIDPLLQVLMETMAAAIADPGDVSALVPILLKVPAETIEKVQHLTFWSELDQQAVPQLEAAIRRLALTLDLPPEVLLGTADINHWGAWQIDESSIKAHIEPALGVICAGLTVEWLRPQLGADADDYFVSFDTTALRLRPNRSKEAIELYDRGEINGDALRRETGFDPDDAMDPQELVRWLLRKMAVGSATPEMVAWAAAQLGVDMPPGLGDVMRDARPDPSLIEHPETGPPDPADAQNPNTAQVAALYATCETLVYRALERAGNRLNNGKRALPPGADPSEAHLFVKATNAQLGTLLEGAWTPLQRLMDGSPYHPDVIERCLDSYCRAVLVNQEPYSRQTMLRYITAGMEIK